MIMVPSTTALIEAVEQADSALELVDTVKALAAQPSPEAIPILIKVLGYNNPGAAVAAVDGLVALGPLVVPELLNLVDGYNYGARAWALRAFSLIGDPRALSLLVETVTTDFSPSVRRAAAKGLGTINWSSLPPEEIDAAQNQALDALGQALDDGEWVVRYGSVVGLQHLGLTFLRSRAQHYQLIVQKLQHKLVSEPEKAVQARLRLACKQLETAHAQVLA